jgi:hypothetical protein
MIEEHQEAEELHNRCLFGSSSIADSAAGQVAVLAAHYMQVEEKQQVQH